MTIPTYPTLKTQILSLPEPERSARRRLFSDWEWENSWELNAYPHQLPPLSDDWKYWTILGSPRTGLSTAGLRWFEHLVMNHSNVTAVALFEGRHIADFHLTEFLMILPGHVKDACTIRSFDGLLRIGDSSFTFRPFLRNDPKLYPSQYTHVWADQILDSEEVSSRFHAAQTLFTQPTKLHPDTHLSIAGKPRAL